MNTTSSPPGPPVTIPQDQIDRYHDEGYLILERVIDDDTLQMLREECSYFMGYQDAELDAEGPSGAASSSAATATSSATATT